jgi:hypothetical protein
MLGVGHSSGFLCRLQPELPGKTLSRNRLPSRMPWCGATTQTEKAPRGLQAFVDCAANAL